MNTTKIDKLIKYLSVLREIIKSQNGFREKIGNYKSVDIIFPPEFDIIERWNGTDELFWEIRFPIEDIDDRTKSARDHLRYIKKRKNETAKS